MPIYKQPANPVFGSCLNLSCFCPASAHLAKAGFFSATSAATTFGLGGLEAGQKILGFEC